MDATCNDCVSHSTVLFVFAVAARLPQRISVGQHAGSTRQSKWCIQFYCVFFATIRARASKCINESLRLESGYGQWPNCIDMCIDGWCLAIKLANILANLMDSWLNLTSNVMRETFSCANCSRPETHHNRDIA